MRVRAISPNTSRSTGVRRVLADIRSDGWHQVWSNAAPRALFYVDDPKRAYSAVRCNRLLGVIVPFAPEYNMGGFL
jgi:hypothetical protein